jgi:hypothetical protein
VIYGAKGSFDAYKAAPATVQSPKTGEGVNFLIVICVITVLAAVAVITVRNTKRNRF